MRHVRESNTDRPSGPTRHLLLLIEASPSYWFWPPILVLLFAVCALAAAVGVDPVEIDGKAWLDHYMQYVRAMARLHEAALSVGGVLAAFTMMVAYMASNSGPSRKHAIFYCLMLFSSVAFVCAVCASARSLYTSQTIIELATHSFPRGEVFWNLTALSAIAGFAGVLSFLAALGIQGYLYSTARGRFTATVALAALFFMVGASLQILHFATL